jgi:aspartyl/asparaginyl-tRNA synthetase
MVISFTEIDHQYQGTDTMGDQSISESQNNLHAEEAASKLNDLIPSERFENRVLNVRRPAISAIFKLHSGICELVVEYMTAAGFYWLHTPRLTNTFIEGDNEFFPIDYFGQHGFLAQSSQFHKQMAIGMNYDRVYEIGPLFRAERKLSTRHLTEV